ncbi:uncharacterized protein LOC130140290 [Syzygium oleosum]|uniref:uncharacterized protein LOC130140290 n=1 Tax=Syzygium oleosum TaxID=219896 RepID=UPI0024BAA415|nr:uncharacterized protein LOC130140290 [Syzygium oleosum]
MHGHSSPSLTPRKPRDAPATAPALSPSPSKKHLLTPPLSTVQRRRTKIAKIEDPKDRSKTLCKRRKGLLKKASDLHELTGAHVALAIVSTKGELRCVCKPSITEIISAYLCREGDVMPTEGLGEWLDWAEKECNSCTTKEDCASLIMKYQVILNCLRKKLMDLGNNPSVKVVAGDDYGVGVGRDSKVLNDDEIDSLKKNFAASHPLLFAFFKNYAHDVDFHNLLTSPVNSAAGGESSEVDSNPACSDLEGHGLDPDDLLGSSGEKFVHSHLKGCENNDDHFFAALEDLNVSL